MENNFLVDTHCHLSLTDDIDTILMEAADNNVKKLIISGCDKKSIRDGLEIIYRYPEIYMTIGFHPDEVDDLTDKDILDLENLLKTNKKIVGIGEIGLDYYHNDMNKERQREVFIKQLDLAEKYDLPVVIHSRDATEDTINILKEYKVIGDMHCFSGSIETARIYINMGYKLGIGGVVTFKNSNLYKVIESIGLENIILETDSPYLTPEPYRGKKNSSKYIPYVAEKIADILGVSVEKVAKITTENASSLFDLE